MKASHSLLPSLFAVVFVHSAIAASASAPTISGSNLRASGDVVATSTTSVQGNSAGASARGSYKVIKVGVSANKSSDSLHAETTAGGAFLDGNTKVLGSTLDLKGTVANSSNSGGTVQAGVLRTTSR
ncbi:hypothetical protein [Candidatus Accumulibacter vicinus]|uniref:Uncharacterized protein n=1 Tax=Candidatus Accumulibacter vicinus TaxID=2954382 RepID=A0A084Y4J2_9PROT|nr:hypothetical protein [Candidatus Accumulibacter vicinus]KFB69636.1 MAG: hypothetical protein CAPSK01_000695 [Candidatus Accumulibacter vicinus]